MVMTEVLIAFLLLTIIFSILYHCIRFSSNLMMQAVDLGKENEYYELSVGSACPGGGAGAYAGGAGASSVVITFRDGGNTCDLNTKVAKKTITYYKADHTTEDTQDIYYYTY